MNFIHNDTVRRIFLSFIAKGVSSIGSIVLLVILGKTFGPIGVGAFALGQTIALASSILAKKGMTISIIKIVAKENNYRLSERLLSDSLLECLKNCTIILLLLLVFQKEIQDFFSVDSLNDIYLYMCLSVIPYSLSLILSSVFKGVNKPELACLVENGVISFVTTLISAIIFETFGKELAHVAMSYLISSTIIFFIGYFYLLKYLKSSENYNEGDLVSESKWLSVKCEINKTSRSFFFINLSAFLQNVLAVFLCAKILSEYDLGLYKAALQIGTVVAFVLIVMNAVYPSKFAYLYRKGQIKELELIASQAATISILLISPIITFAMIYPSQLLGILGDGFEEASLALRMVCVAQLINVATGSVGYLLNMTGNEKVMRNIVLFTNGTGVVLIYLFTTNYGYIGAVAASSICMIMQNILALVFVKIKLGFLNTPSISSLSGLSKK